MLVFGGVFGANYSSIGFTFKAATHGRFEVAFKCPEFAENHVLLYQDHWDPYHSYMVYLPTFWLMFMVNVGRYTSHMDAMIAMKMVAIKIHLNP